MTSQCFKTLPGPSLLSLSMNPLRCILQMVSHYGYTRKSHYVVPWYNVCKARVTLYFTLIRVLLIVCPEFQRQLGAEGYISLLRRLEEI